MGQTVGVLAPMRLELSAVVKAMGLRREAVGRLDARVGTVGTTRVVATLTGIGTELARQATERLLDAVEVDLVVVSGIAGAVGASVEVGDLLVPERVIDHASGREHRPTTLGSATPWGTIMTTDDLFTEPDRIAELEQRGIVALDMETSAIAEVCEKQGIAWAVFRALSDRAGDPAIDEEVAALAKPDGSADLPASARYILRHPTRLPSLARLGRQSQRAAARAARAAASALALPER